MIGHRDWITTDDDDYGGFMLGNPEWREDPNDDIGCSLLGNPEWLNRGTQDDTQPANAGSAGAGEVSE